MFDNNFNVERQCRQGSSWSNQYFQQLFFIKLFNNQQFWHGSICWRCSIIFLLRSGNDVEHILKCKYTLFCILQNVFIIQRIKNRTVLLMACSSIFEISVKIYIHIKHISTYSKNKIQFFSFQNQLILKYNKIFLNVAFFLISFLIFLLKIIALLRLRFEKNNKA